MDESVFYCNAGDLQSIDLIGRIRFLSPKTLHVRNRVVTFPCVCYIIKLQSGGAL